MYFLNLLVGYTVITMYYLKAEPSGRAVSGVGLRPFQGSPTDCGVSECDREASITRRPCPTGGCRAMKKN
jgi:hypothetical protein